jgi:hypothetical protein
MNSNSIIEKSQIIKIIGLVIFIVISVSVENRKIMIIDKSIKCLFGEPNCMDGDLDTKDLSIGLLFFFLGLNTSYDYFFVLTLAIIIQFASLLLNNRAKFIITPLISLTFYSIALITKSAYRKYIKTS